MPWGVTMIAGRRQPERLLDVGTVGGLNDAELIEGFAAADVDREPAEPAFAARGARHRRMILSVCRRFLRPC